MPSIRLRASVYSLDVDKYVEALDEAVKKAYIAAGRKFLLAAGEIINQHVWTGMLRGAFRNLEDVVGRLGTTGKIEGKRGGRKDNKPERRAYYHGQLRTPELGRSFATPADQIITKGRVVKGGAQNVTVFKFSVDIDYYRILDEGPLGPNAGNWQSFKAGITAFEEELKKHLTKMPDINRYVTKKEIG